MSKFERRPDDRPAELLDAALARFREVGYATARVEEIAAAAGVTVGTVYRYFPGKDSLFQAVIERDLDPAWSRGPDITEAYGTRTPRGVLTLLLSRLAETLRQPATRDVLLLVVREAASFPVSVQLYCEQLLKRGCISVERALRHGIDRGEFPLLPVELTARAMVCAVQQQAIWEATFGEALGEPRNPDEQSELAIAMLVRGLPNPDSASRPTLPTMRAATLPPPGQTGEHPIPGRVRIVTLKRPGAD
ncbi:MAG: TetR/AcrR family transcriptional regulator [Gemmatimonadota bacterium]